MLEVHDKKRFRKDYKKLKSSGKDLKKLVTVINLLREAKGLPDKYNDHELIGNYVNHRECHIESDWLLIYQLTETHVVLVRTGSHSQVFDM